MRMLMLHVDYFRSTISNKGRSKIIEEPEFEITEVKEALIIYQALRNKMSIILNPYQGKLLNKYPN